MPQISTGMTEGKRPAQCVGCGYIITARSTEETDYQLMGVNKCHECGSEEFELLEPENMDD